MKKSIFAQALNIIVNPMISKFVNNRPLYGQNGVAEMALIYHLVMGGMMVFFYIFNPNFVFKTIILKLPFLRNLYIYLRCNRNTQNDNVNSYHKNVHKVYDLY